MKGSDNMMYSLDLKAIDSIVNSITDDEITKYESTQIDNKLISWAKENCKDNYISLKKQVLISNLIIKFDKDENLVDYFSTWDYSTDYLRTSMIYLNISKAAFPTNNWSKNSIFILSTKNLYIINSSQFYDYINTITFNLQNPKNLRNINLYKNKKEEILEIRYNNNKLLYKTDKNFFSSLINQIDSKYSISSNINIKKSKKPPIPIGKIFTYIFIIWAIIYGLSALYYTFTELF